VRAQLLAGVRAVVVLTVLCGLAFPLFVTGVAHVFWNDKARGSLVERDGKVVGSSLIAQSFTRPEYFHPRPSAAGSAATGAEPDDPTAVASGPSNAGPTNREFLALVSKRVKAYRRENGLPADTRVPVDAVTASGSGLDPQISVANARLQASRVARARGITEDQVQHLVDEHTEHASLGFLGEKGVNVLELNLALDAVESA
jgi:K+-transporting ATPase ATPase C chain